MSGYLAKKNLLAVLGILFVLVPLTVGMETIYVASNDTCRSEFILDYHNVSCSEWISYTNSELVGCACELYREAFFAEGRQLVCSLDALSEAFATVNASEPGLPNHVIRALDKFIVLAEKYILPDVCSKTARLQDCIDVNVLDSDYVRDQSIMGWIDLRKAGKMLRTVCRHRNELFSCIKTRLPRLFVCIYLGAKEINDSSSAGSFCKSLHNMRNCVNIHTTPCGPPTQTLMQEVFQYLLSHSCPHQVTMDTGTLGNSALFYCSIPIHMGSNYLSPNVSIVRGLQQACQDGVVTEILTCLSREIPTYSDTYSTDKLLSNLLSLHNLVHDAVIEQRLCSTHFISETQKALERCQDSKYLMSCMSYLNGGGGVSMETLKKTSFDHLMDKTDLYIRTLYCFSWKQFASCALDIIRACSENVSLALSEINQMIMVPDCGGLQLAPPQSPRNEL